VGGKKEAEGGQYRAFTGDEDCVFGIIAAGLLSVTVQLYFFSVAVWIFIIYRVRITTMIAPCEWEHTYVSTRSLSKVYTTWVISYETITNV